MADLTAVQQEIAEEQRHVDRVYARLEQLRRTALEAEREGYRHARVGTMGALVERDALVFHAARRRYELDSEYEGLVFGRLDLRGGEVYHIGRLGVRDVDARPLVIDWRAPAAAAFYQATAADPRGVVRRRSIQSSGEKVTGVSDDLLDPAAAPPGMRVVGDGALLASLSRATGRGMRDIVATIQREQDAAIRSPASGVTIVSGGPGTGKTAVALHRAAYLLYADRARFAGGGILVVGPSPVFVNYISQVLPSLGEDAATLHSLGSLVEGMRATRVDPPDVAAVKGSLRMRRVLERAVRDAVPGAPTELRLLYRGELLRLGPAELEAIRRAALPRGARRNEVRRAGIDGLFDALWAQAEQVTVRAGRSRADFEDEMSDRPEFRAFLRAWWPMLRPVDVLGWLADPQRLRAYASGVLSAAEVSKLDFSGPVSVADVALLDELDELLGVPPQQARRRREAFQVSEGVYEVTTFADRQQAARARASAAQRPENYRDYAHVVVDEAQDVSPMQWRMLGRRGRYASWTVVGDPAQTAWTGDPAELTRARDAALGTRRRSEHVLTTNYRNSAEIFARAAAVIRELSPDIELPTAVRSTGVSPVEREVPADQLAGAVRTAAEELLDQVEGTVGVITPIGRRDEMARWLDRLDPARLQVVDSLEAKGMEYDGVVLVEPAEIRGGGASGVRTLYVALSRATQRLTIVSTQRPPTTLSSQRPPTILSS
ncbi:MAG: AAA family ATPase, partial [Micromonosporaceae bacterium]|nr:AAA family ATPase [Micromonosporaceae bacterium]